MHGARANRLELLSRIKFLREAGYSVFAFDFQGCGESKGERLSFGYFESRDAEAAVRFTRERLPGEKIGVVGISMGGAAYLLAKDRPNVDALILEMVYPAMRRAIENRLDLWFFSGAGYFTPLMTAQFPFRIGVSVDELRPIDRIREVKAPILLIAGENDRHTTLEESRQLFEAADQPKEVWIVPRAIHGDLHKFTPNEYEENVLRFLGANLRGEKK